MIRGWQYMTTSNVTIFSVQKSAARIFRGRITGIARNPGEKAIRKTWFCVMSIVKFLTYSIF
jgi:hypothetical protein